MVTGLSIQRSPPLSLDSGFRIGPRVVDTFQESPVTLACSFEVSDVVALVAQVSMHAMAARWACRTSHDVKRTSGAGFRFSWLRVHIRLIRVQDVRFSGLPGPRV